MGGGAKYFIQPPLPAINMMQSREYFDGKISLSSIIQSNTE